MAKQQPRDSTSMANMRLPDQRRRRVRLMLRGMALDISTEHMNGYAMDAKNMLVGPDGTYLIAPCGGRIITHPELHKPDAGAPAGYTTPEALADYEMRIFSCDPMPFNRSDGLIFAAVDSQDRIVGLSFFSGEEQAKSIAPIQDYQPPRLSLLKPREGTIYGKDSVTITWAETGDRPAGADYIKIVLRDSTGAVAETIASSTENDGSYAWTVSNTLSGTYTLRIEAVANEYYYDESNEITITPSDIFVVIPNSTGWKINRGNALWIQWYSVANVGANVKIEVYRNPTTPVLAYTVVASTANTAGLNTYGPWTVPIGATLAADYFVRITDLNDGTIYGDGATFEIQGQTGSQTATIEVIAPPYSDGHAWTAGGSTPETISWRESGSIGTSVNVDLYYGDTYVLRIASAIATLGSGRDGANSCSYSPPDSLASGSSYKIKVTSNSGVTDTGSAFTVKPLRRIRITSRNLQGVRGQTIGVTWTSQNAGSTVRIAGGRFSTGGGFSTSYFSFGYVSNIEGENSHIDTIPSGARTGTYSLQVKSKDYPEVMDITPITVNPSLSNSNSYYALWSRDAATPQHQIWKANLYDGANAVAKKFITWSQTAVIEDSEGYAGAYGTSMPTLRQMITDRDGAILTMWMDADDSGVRRPRQTTGSGLNDIQTRANTKYSGTKPKTYTITLSATGTPDQFDWSDGDGGSGTGVAITGAWQALNNNVEIMFAATTGHTLNNAWTFEGINDFPLTRIGDTARVKKYDGITGEEVWCRDCAAAIRTLEAAANEVHILEHAALAVSATGTVFVALAGWTLTGATYARKIWVQRLTGTTGALAETTVAVSSKQGTINAASQIGICGLYGACWSPDGQFWLVADDKKSVDDGTVAYNPKEFLGKLWRFSDSDLTDNTGYQPTPEGATYQVMLGVSYQKPGMLQIPVFYLYDEGGSNEEYRLGLLEMSLNGKTLRVLSFGYNDATDNVFSNWCHPGGMSGFERNGTRLGTMEGNWIQGVRGGGIDRPSSMWLTDGQRLWQFDTEHFRGLPRRVDAGGTVGQGTYHTYNCHGLTRLANADFLHLSFEYQDATFATTDLRMRLRVVEPSRGGTRFEIVSEHDSADEPNQPYIPQPFVWYGGPDANGYNTETNKPEFPWLLLAVSGPTEGE